MTYANWVTENIGKVDKWEDDKKRLLVKEVVGGEEKPPTWRVEANDGRRGKLTQWSNISAWAGEPAEFSQKKEMEFIQDIVGGLVGGKDGIEGLPAGVFPIPREMKVHPLLLSGTEMKRVFHGGRGRAVLGLDAPGGRQSAFP